MYNIIPTLANTPAHRMEMSASIGSELLSVKSRLSFTIAAIPHLFLMRSYISPLSHWSFKAPATHKNSAVRFLFCATIDCSIELFFFASLGNGPSGVILLGIEKRRKKNKNK